MKVEDPEQALTEAVCSRVREQLTGPMPSSPRRSRASSTAGWRRRTWRSATRSTSTAWRSATSTSRASAPPGTPKVRVYNPRFEEHGWQSTHTAVEIVTDDMPFLIDSVSMELNRRGCGVHLIIHPVLRVRRDADGAARDPPAARGARRGRDRRVRDPRRGGAPDRPEPPARARAAPRARDRRGARRRRGLAGDERARRSRRRADARRGGRRGGRLPRVARRRQLHLPRLPRRGDGPGPRDPARARGGGPRRPASRATPAASR